MPSVLLVDNYDSFTFNLVELLRQIGAEVEVVAVDAVQLEQAKGFSHLLFSPGADVPSAYPQLFALLEAFYAQKSFLGVCLGHQAIAQFFGARLVHLPQVCHGVATELLQVAENPLFAGLPSRFQVGLYHSWAVTDLPEALTVTAVSTAQTVMAFAHDVLPIYGIQFHPESYISEYGAEILRNWLRCAPSTA